MSRSLLNLFIKLALISSVYSFSTGFSVSPVTLRNKYATRVCKNINVNMQEMPDRRDMVKNLALTGIGISLFNSIEIANVFTNEEYRQKSLYKKAVSSVGYISTEYKNVAKKLNYSLPGGELPRGVGTGFVWDDQGHIVTNFHVINKVDCAEVMMINKDGITKKYMARLTGVDPDKDIAVLKIDVSAYDDIKLVPIPLGANKDIQVGQNAYAIGNPFGQEYTLTVGVISGKMRSITSPSGRKIPDMIQTDAAINPGNSGGPLLDSSGRLVGMNTATYGQGVSSGVNFAVSIDTIKNSVDQIIKYGVVQRAVLGISFLERRPSASESNSSGFPVVEKGIIVLDVPKTSPAYDAGLRGLVNGTLGDVVISIDNFNIDNTNDLLAALDTYKPGDKVKLGVLRSVEKTPVTINVVLASFKVEAYSGMNSENFPKNQSIPTVPLDIPLKQMAPKLKP